MVQGQLCNLEHLMNSGFGRPFPRHGLQLLFWFANDCVTCEIINLVVLMKLVSNCQPENGFYGFHHFGNSEELLPVLDRPRGRKTKRQVDYFEVGNLNTETYPAAANLPTYVRENYGFGDSNTDRIIINYQVRSRVVETVYITEHDGGGSGGFSPAGTYEVSFELIQALQNQQLDLSTFLTQMGYLIDETHYPGSSAEQMFDMFDMFDTHGFFSDTFKQQLGINMEPFNYTRYTVNATSHNSRCSANHGEVQRKHRKPKAIKRPRALEQRYWPPAWEELHEGLEYEVKKRSGGGHGGGGGVSFMKILLGVGALYLAVKCFSWLTSSWEVNLRGNTLKKIPCRHPHVMLDYVY